MAKKKIYAVRIGRKKGLFNSWDECKESIDGYPNAQYKGFSNMEEAKNYLASDSSKKVSTDINTDVSKEIKNDEKTDINIDIKPYISEAQINKEGRKVFDSLQIYKMMEDKRGNVFFREDGEWKNIRHVLPKKFIFSNIVLKKEELFKKAYLLKEDMIYAFVDGSYNVKEGIYGGGILFITGEGKFARISIRSINEEGAEMRNVAGEILASSIAMNIASLKGYRKLVIAYDYKGIEEWALGNWKRNKLGTKKYKEEFDHISKNIKIWFKKIEAHSGHIFNDEADYLAKLSVGNIILR